MERLKVLKIKVQLKPSWQKFLMNVPDQNNFTIVNKTAREIYKKDGGIFLVSGLTKAEKFRAEIEKRKKE